MNITKEQAQHALDNLENQLPFMNEYAYNTIHTFIEDVIRDLSAEGNEPKAWVSTRTTRKTGKKGKE